MTAANPAFKKLGRVASLGPSEPWQVALLLPEGFDDFRMAAASIADLDREPRPIRLHITGSPRASYDRVPRLRVPVREPGGLELGATIFGDTKKWLEALKGVESAVFLCLGSEYRGSPQIEIREIIEDHWVGKIRPRYPGKRQVIAPQTTRKTVQALLPEAIPIAAAFIKDKLNPPVPMAEVLRQIGAEGWTVEQLLEQAHAPLDMAYAKQAGTVIRRLAALGALLQLPARGAGPLVPQCGIALPTLASRVAQLPYQNLTDDQRNAIAQLSHAIGLDRPMFALNSGEVGSGKTSVATVLISAVADAGRRAMVLCPNTLLARQFAAEFKAHHPDVDMQLVTGDTQAGSPLQARVLIGTSALLHRDTGPEGFSFVILDEQHRFSRQQREQHVGPKTHVMEMSATPIPRTLALFRYGDALTLQMKQSHAKKEIKTHLMDGAQGRRRLFQRLKVNLAKGDKVLIVHPKREAADTADQDKDLLGKNRKPKSQDAAPGGIDDRHSVAQAFERWNAAFPGKVGSLTSDDDEATKGRVLDQLGTGEIQILVCTTVIEVGITIPELFLIAIVCPERLGLMQLHQLRGRVARHGGTGHCILYSPDGLNPKQQARLEFFAGTNDGFALAEFDMFERGAGDLSSKSSRQTGADETFLYGVKMDVRAIDEVAPLVESWRKSKLAQSGAIEQVA